MAIATDAGARPSGRRARRNARIAVLCWLAAASLLLVSSAATLASASRASFGAPTNFAVGTYPRAVAVGHFNADSDPDLAVANYGSDNVSVLLGRAGGGFGARTNLAVGDGPRSIAIGDFNGDSDPDLAVANSSSNNVSIRLGGPGGSFGASSELPTNTYPSSAVGDAVPTSVAVGDFNRDSDPDLVVTNSLRGNILVWLGETGGSFGAPTDFPVGEFPQSVAVGDFNADSDPDLAVANLGFAGSSDPSISVLLGGAGGTFASAANLVLPPRPGSVAVGDFNADSDPDLAVANSRNVSILLGGVGGSFGAPTSFLAGRDLNTVVVGHLNGDSDPDLAVVNGFSGNLTTTVSRSCWEGPAEASARRAASQLGTTPLRSRSATSTPTRTQTSRSPTSTPTTSRFCSTTPPRPGPGSPPVPRVAPQIAHLRSGSTPASTARSLSASWTARRSGPVARRAR